MNTLSLHQSLRHAGILPGQRNREMVEAGGYFTLSLIAYFAYLLFI